jgi:hypothetical protein
MIRSLRKLNHETALIRHRITSIGNEKMTIENYREKLKMLRMRIEDLSAVSVRSDLQNELEAVCLHDWTLKCGYNECGVCHKIKVTN